MDTLRAQATPTVKNFPRVKADDRHNIQTHVSYLELLVSSYQRMLSRGRRPSLTEPFFFFFSPLPLVSTEKSPRASERHPQLSDVSRCHRCAHPDSAQQYRETGKSLIGETKPELRVYLLFMDDMNDETSADLPVPQRR